MNALLQWGGHPAVYRLGWTLLHFLWQGAVVAGLFAVAQTGWRKRSSNARYWTGCLALALMLAAPVITFIALGAERAVPGALAPGGTGPGAAKLPALGETAGMPGLKGQIGQIGQIGPTSLPIAPASSPQSAIRNPQFPHWHSEKFIPGFVLGWLLGVSALSLRLLLGSLRVARLKRRGHEPPGALWLDRLDRLRTALQISRPVRLVKSVLVEVPAVVGWLRPVILLPAASLAGLTPAQLEAILAHELAHVRRHDYLVNLLQNALETLLFYHPAVWWVSSCVRAEREICCDEIAVKLCGDRLVYAQALAALEQLRAGGRPLALGADGGSLLERIRRLSGAPSGGSFPSRRRAGGALVAALVAVILVSLLHHPASNAKAQSTTPAAPKQTNAAPGAVNSSRPAPVVAWGEPIQGLQVGLACTNLATTSDRQPLFDVHLRNRLDRPLAIPSEDAFISLPRADWPEFRSRPLMPRITPLGEGRTTYFITGGVEMQDARATRRVLGPGETVVVSNLPLSAGTFVPGQDLYGTKTSEQTYLLLPGGKYRVAYVFESAQTNIEREPVWHGKASSGELTVTVRQPAPGAGLKASFQLPKTNFFVGELIYATLNLRCTNAKPVSFANGADYFNGRDARYSFTATDEAGRPVPDPLLNHPGVGGGPGGPLTLKPGATFSDRVLVNLYLKFTNAGHYTLVCHRTLYLVEPGKLGPEEIAPQLPVESKFRIKLVRDDKAHAREVEQVLAGYDGSQNEQISAWATARDETAFPEIEKRAMASGRYQSSFISWAAEYGEQGVPALLVAARSSEASCRSLALSFLAEMKAKEVPELVKASLASTDARERAEAVLQCSKQRLPGTLECLLAMGQDPDPLVRRYLGAALGACGDERAVPVLLDLLQDANPDPFIRIWAAGGLSALGHKKESVPILIDLLRTIKPRDGAGNVIECLKGSTGQDLGQDPARWIEWWEKEGTTNNGGAIPSSGLNRTNAVVKTPAPSNANAGEPTPAAPSQTNAAAATSNPQSAIRNPQSAAGPLNSSTPAANPSGLSLVIRGRTNVVHVGDEIPIEFIISNHGTEDYTTYAAGTIYSTGRDERFNLTARTASGESVPDPRMRIHKGISKVVATPGVSPLGQSRIIDWNAVVDFATPGVVYPAESAPPARGTIAMVGSEPVVLHPGESFSRTIPLNRWALIKEPGRYEVAGNYQPFYTDNSIAPIHAEPIRVPVLPRTKEELHDYINGLTNQVAAQWAVKAGKPKPDGGFDFPDPVLLELLSKLMYTCSPEIVPALLTTASEAGMEGDWAVEALRNYVPETEDTRQAILQQVARHGVNQYMEQLLLDHDFNHQELRPVVERALALHNSGEWQAGAVLAAHFYDDAFAKPLVAIALDSNAPLKARFAASETLAANRTEAGAKMFKRMLNDPDPQIWEPLILAIENGYRREMTQTGRPLQPEDFDAQDLTPFIERLLASSTPSDVIHGVSLAEWSGAEEVVAKLAALAVNPRATDREGAIQALARNRTDAGVKALKTLLNDDDSEIWRPLAEAIEGRSSGWSPLPTRRPQKPEDFDATEVRPLIEKMLASSKLFDQSGGLGLAALFGDDALTPKLLALATNPGFIYRGSAIRALAFHRTDEGVRTLKALLNDPDQQVSDMAEQAIRHAYTLRGNARGRPLRADDFDAKYQQPELTPPTPPRATNNDGAIPSSGLNRTNAAVKTPAPSNANAGEPPPAAPRQTNAATATSNPQSAIRNPQSAAGPLNSSKPAANPSGLSLVIRGPTNAVKVGDEVPIEFIISNHGSNDYTYEDRNSNRSGRLDEYTLAAKTSSGESVPDPRATLLSWMAGGTYGPGLLHPGESFTKIIPLNRWALIKEPGRYEVTGSYLGDDSVPYIERACRAGPIFVTVLPRTTAEMDDYIKVLTNQLAARLSAHGPDNYQYDGPLDDSMMKLMYTCSPEIVPSLLGPAYEVESFWADEALLYYVPRSEEIWQAILKAAATFGMQEKTGVNGNRQYVNMQSLLLNYGASTEITLVNTQNGPQPQALVRDYGVNMAELKPLIERALAAENPGQWQAGATLAANSCYDDSFTARLIAIASDPMAPANSRGPAFEALARNRTDAGVKALKSLLNDPDPKISAMTEQAIRHAYTSRGNARGRPLRADDFDAKYQQPQLTPPMNPAATNRDSAIPSRDVNGKDAAVMTPAPSNANTGEPPPAAPRQTNAAAATSNPQSAIRNPQSAARPVNPSTPAANPSGLSLVIRGPTNAVKVGDRIPIEFILSNPGSADYEFQYFDDDLPYRQGNFTLSATTASGVSVPDPRARYKAMATWSDWGRERVLHPGGSFTNVLPLNRWALMNEAGHYEVSGAFVGGNYFFTNLAQVRAAPISITVLPRTQEEMHDCISGLTNQIAVRLPIRPARQIGGVRYDPVLDARLEDLMYTCSPEMIPALLWILDQPGAGNEALLAMEGMMNYAPHTAETRKAIFDEAVRHGLTVNLEFLITRYDFTKASKEEIRPLVERALDPRNSGQWTAGASLAACAANRTDFAPRLIEIASGTNTPDNARGAAIGALAYIRTDAGVKALKALLNDPDPAIWSTLANAIVGGFESSASYPIGLRPDDFEVAEVRPLAERLLTSSNSYEVGCGVRLAEKFGFDDLTPLVVALAVKSSSQDQFPAIDALAMNRTDLGVRTLKMLLEGTDLTVSKIVEKAIRRAYTSRGNALGRPLRGDDFDAKFQQPEVRPAK
jgi:beta-lactamase regulating signal transducer with metallopeptidase domain/HEAT repeat protein